MILEVRMLVPPNECGNLLWIDETKSQLKKVKGKIIQNRSTLPCHAIEHEQLVSHVLRVRFVRRLLQSGTRSGRETAPVRGEKLEKRQRKPNEAGCDQLQIERCSLER